jgi:hypothetical protein
MGKIQIVPSERLLDPVWDTDERWTVDIVTHTAIHVWTDDGFMSKARDLHAVVLRRISS